MSFCSNCGSPLKEQQCYCQSCGMDVTSLSAHPNPVSTSSSPILTPQNRISQSCISAETLKFILTEIKLIPNKQDRPLYTLILTDQRIIFARLTPQISQEAGRMMQVNDQGKGFWGKWKSQVSGHNWIKDRYNTINPEQALRETPDNFAIFHPSVRSVLIKYYHDDDGESEYYFEMQTDSQLVKFSTIRNYEKEFEQIYPQRVSKKSP